MSILTVLEETVAKMDKKSRPLIPGIILSETTSAISFTLHQRQSLCGIACHEQVRFFLMKKFPQAVQNETIVINYQYIFHHMRILSRSTQQSFTE